MIAIVARRILFGRTLSTVIKTRWCEDWPITMENLISESKPIASGGAAWPLSGTEMAFPVNRIAQTSMAYGQTALIRGCSGFKISEVQDGIQNTVIQ